MFFAWYGEDIFLGTWEGPHVFSQPGVFSGFWGIGFLLFFHCFLIVFPLFLCWNICWNVGCVVFVVLIVDVCVVIFGSSPKVMTHPYKYRGSKKWWKILNKKVMIILLFMRRVVCLFVCCWNNEEHVQMSNEQMREREGDIHLQEHEASFGNDEAYLQ